MALNINAVCELNRGGKWNTSTLAFQAVGGVTNISLSIYATRITTKWMNNCLTIGIPASKGSQSAPKATCTYTAGAVPDNNILTLSAFTTPPTPAGTIDSVKAGMDLLIGTVYYKIISKSGSTVTIAGYLTSSASGSCSIWNASRTLDISLMRITETIDIEGYLEQGATEVEAQVANLYQLAGDFGGNVGCISFVKRQAFYRYVGSVIIKTFTIEEGAPARLDGSNIARTQRAKVNLTLLFGVPK